MTELETANQRVAALEAELAAMRAMGEPVAWLDPWTGTNVTTDYDAYGKHGIPLYTAPQPSPAAQGDALDAAVSLPAGRRLARERQTGIHHPPATQQPMGRSH